MSEMATKQQERDAIKKIEGIVKSLGPDSYVGTAMKGVLEIAEQNIEYDFADNLADRAEVATQKAEECAEKARVSKAASEAFKAQLEATEERHKKDLATAKCNAERKSEELISGKDAELAAAQQTIINLKAELYDYIMRAAH